MAKILSVVFCVVLAGCTAVPITGPKTYSDEHMSFSVPADWKVTMHGKRGGCGYAFVEAPGEAVVFIKGVPVTQDKGLDQTAAKFSKDASPRVPMLKIKSGGMTAFADKRYGRGLKERVTLTLLNVDVPHTRYYRMWRAEPCVFYIMTQVADEDAVSVESGFREILATFRTQ